MNTGQQDTWKTTATQYGTSDASDRDRNRIEEFKTDIWRAIDRVASAHIRKLNLGLEVAIVNQDRADEFLGELQKTVETALDDFTPHLTKKLGQ